MDDCNSPVNRACKSSRDDYPAEFHVYADIAVQQMPTDQYERMVAELDRLRSHFAADRLDRLWIVTTNCDTSILGAWESEEDAEQAADTLIDPPRIHQVWIRRSAVEPQRGET